MLVKDLVDICYDTIYIYKPCDNDMLDFIDLYKGGKDTIPNNLLYSEVRIFGAKRKGIIDIAVKE